MKGILTDAFGRTVTNLRISVTDRCNFRCRYCMPEEGMLWMDRGELLTFEEIVRVARVFAELGVTAIRLTGGEPLMRKNLCTLVGGLTAVRGLEDISLTTNGFFLLEQLDGLVTAGLRRVTVSLDSLDPRRFAEMTRRDYFDRVIAALDAAERSPLRPVKVNVVIMRGINDSEIGAFASMARRKPFIVRFIEYMPIGAGDEWERTKVVPSCELIRRIESEYPTLVPLDAHDGHAAERYRFTDGIGELGFISSVSEPFCSSCNRVRLTSDGKLRTCLFSLHETDLRAPLRSGAADDELRSIITGAVAQKEEGHLINTSHFVKPERTMSSIGG